MSNKTNVIANPGRQEIVITREFDAPRELVFKAHTDPAIYANWIGPRDLITTIEIFEPRNGGSWRFISTDKDGNQFGFHGVFHEVLYPQRMIGTFEFEGLPEAGHVEFDTSTFEELPGGRTRLTILAVYQTVEDRDGMIANGMEIGMNDGFSRLDELLQKGTAGMSKVHVELSMSLDGFIAGPNDGPENGLGDGGDALFKWYGTGDTDFPLPGTDMVFKIPAASAEFLKESWSNIGASVTGRRTFDIAHGWGGNPPGGGPYFVLTHDIPDEWVKEGSPFTFVTDGIESAIAQAKQVAGEKNVDLMGASIVQQCIRAGLIDQIQIDLVPVLLGGGVRLFDHLGITPVQLETIGVVSTPDVTHLRYRVIK